MDLRWSMVATLGMDEGKFHCRTLRGPSLRRVPVASDATCLLT